MLLNGDGTDSVPAEAAKYLEMKKDNISFDKYIF